MKTLNDFRLRNNRVHTPSPVSAGLAFIALGVGMIWDHLRILPRLVVEYVYWKARKRFYRVQRWLIWFWTGHLGGYTLETARRVWIRTILSLIGTALMLVAYATDFFFR